MKFDFGNSVGSIGLLATMAAMFIEKQVPFEFTTKRDGDIVNIPVIRFRTKSAVLYEVIGYEQDNISLFVQKCNYESGDLSVTAKGYAAVVALAFDTLSLADGTMMPINIHHKVYDSGALPG